MTASKTLVYCCLAFIAGIFLHSLVKIPCSLSLNHILLLFLLFAFLIFLFWKRKGFLIVSLSCLFLVFGFFCYQSAMRRIEENTLKKYNNSEKTVILEGIVVEEPVVSTDRLKIVVTVTDFETGTIMKQEKLGKILITTNRYPEFRYGDKVRVRGKLETPPIFDGFNYQNYLAKEGIFSVVYWPEVKLIGENKGNLVLRKLFSLKQRLEDSLNKLMTPPQSAILEALLFGDEENLSQEWKDKFNLTGTRHIAAVSGMNITIVSALILNFLLGLGFWRNQAFYFSLVLIIFYILMIGAPASAVRAGIMAGLFLIAQHFGRFAVAYRAVIIAASLMLLKNPLLLIWDVGFQLSCLAILGLIYLQPFFLNLFKKVPSVFQARNTLAATFSVQVFTLPVLIYNFGRIPILGPLANILIVPFLPLITISGFAFSFLGIFWRTGGQILSWPVWLLLSYLLAVVNEFSRISIVSLIFKNIHWIWLGLYYLLLIYFVWQLEKKSRQPNFL